MRTLFTILLSLIVLHSNLFGQFAKSIVEANDIPRVDPEFGIPVNSEMYTLDMHELAMTLNGSAPTIVLPYNGRAMVFDLTSYAIMESPMAERYSTIHTYYGYSSNGAMAYIDITDGGLHAAIEDDGTTYYIDPVGYNGHTYYASYNISDYVPLVNSAIAFSCESNSNPALDPTALSEDPILTFRKADPIALRTYVLALATTIEFCAQAGGSVEATMDLVVTTLNRINMIMHRDLAARLMLKDGTDNLFYCGGFDPYSNCNTSAMIEENPPVIRGQFPALDYDIGHVFGQGGGGLASVGSLCSTNSRERGVSCTPGQLGDRFSVGIAAHELGHQFGAHHSFNGANGSCGGNINSSSAYEPGSGSTIMSYAGICGSDNVRNTALPYYNNYAMDQIYRHINNSADECATKEQTDNTPPELSIDMPNNVVIPISTPFELEGSAFDQEDTDLTFTWEQFDLGPQSELGRPTNGLGPLFHYIDPSTSPTRTFPAIDFILNDQFTIREILPFSSRDLTFRLTARDNNPNGGGVNWMTYAFKADASAGPFKISKHNSPAALNGYDYVELTWDVANTNVAPVNAQFVDIYYSVDGGFTFPHMWAKQILNDGHHRLRVPNVDFDLFRYKVKGSDNIFFDINNANLSVSSSIADGFDADISPSFVYLCGATESQFVVSTSSFGNFTEMIMLEIIALDPDLEEVNITIDKDNLSPGDSATISISIDPRLPSQIVQFGLQATTSTLDTVFVDFGFNYLNSFFGDQNLLVPADGSKDQSITQIFEWMPSSSAAHYRFELATDVLFSEIIYFEDNITETTLDLTQFPLEINTTYYWRLKPSSSCVEGDYSEVNVFHTSQVVCETFLANDVPIRSIPGETAYSTFTFTEDRTISDLNVLNVLARSNNVEHTVITLESPSGEQARLYNKACSGVAIDLDFDDDVQADIICPPNDGNRHQPWDPLSVFVGESTLGDWRMSVFSDFNRVVELLNWELEFCADNAIHSPDLIVNNGLIIEQYDSKGIGSDLLAASDNTIDPSDLVFTIVTTTSYGQLLLNNQAVSIGETFTQSDIDNGRIGYAQNSAIVIDDYFKFTLSNPNGGISAGYQFDINVLPKIVSTNELPLLSVKVFPNPAQTDFTIAMDQVDYGQWRATLYDTSGRLARSLGILNGDRATFPLNDLATGLYMLVIVSEYTQPYVQKIIIQ